MRIKFKLLIFAFIFALLFVDFIPAEAALVRCGTGSTNFCTVCDVFSLTSRIITFILIDIVTPLSIIAFIAGGIILVTAGGNPQRVSTGRKILITTIIGILLAFGAWLIVDTIIGNIANVSLATRNIYFPWDEFPKCD